MSRKRVHDHNESNDEQPSTAVVVVAAAETSKAAGATVELESTRPTSSKTKKGANYSEMELANSSSMSETGVNKALASPATTSNSNLANGAQKRAAAESTEKATAKTPKSTSKLTNRRRFYK